MTKAERQSGNVPSWDPAGNRSRRIQSRGPENHEREQTFVAAHKRLNDLSALISSLLRPPSPLPFLLPGKPVFEGYRASSRTNSLLASECVGAACPRAGLARQFRKNPRHCQFAHQANVADCC